MKKIALILVGVLMVGLLSGCTEEATREDTKKTLQVGNSQVERQPTPSDLGTSIARYLLIRRAYWLNGDFAKAYAYQCPVPTLPIGQIEIYNGGTLIKTEPVVGAVICQDTYLTADSEYYERSDYRNNWLPDVDGTFGSNGGGIFWFTPEGEMREWGGNDYYFRPSMGETLSPVKYIEFTTAPEWAIEMQAQKEQYRQE